MKKQAEIASKVFRAGLSLNRLMLESAYPIHIPFEMMPGKMVNERREPCC